MLLDTAQHRRDKLSNVDAAPAAIKRIHLKIYGIL